MTCFNSLNIYQNHVHLLNTLGIALMTAQDKILIQLTLLSTLASPTNTKPNKSNDLLGEMLSVYWLKTVKKVNF